MSWRKSTGEQVRSFTGIGASPGIAIGKAFVLSSEGFHIFPRAIPDGEVEPSRAVPQPLPATGNLLKEKFSQRLMSRGHRNI
jgi:hypothetical protein